MEPSTPTTRWVLIVGVVLLVLLGGFLRVWALGRETVNADEAIVGLMAHQILHGHFSAFYWGQNYGGAEPYLVAVVFLLFGQSTFTLGLTPVLLAAVAALLVWRIGRRLFSPEVGIAAGVALWVWPEVFLWQSTLEYGFRFVVLDAGLVGVLLALDLAERPGARREMIDFVGIGIAFGIGWWASPEIVYFAVPAVVPVVLGCYRQHRGFAVVPVVTGIVTFVIGALPWIVANIASGGASLRSGPQPDPSFTSHLDALRLHVVPIYLGLAVPSTGTFVVPHVLGQAIEYLALLAGIATLVLLVRQQRAYVVAAMAVFFPFAYAASPFTWYWEDGRYAIYLVPTLALLGTGGIDAVVTWVLSRVGSNDPPRATDARRGVLRRSALGAFLALAAVLTLVDARLVRPFRPGSVAGSTWTSWSSDATGYASVVADGLRAAGVRDVIAGYWIAEPVTFASRGEVVASDVRYDRQPGALAEIDTAGPAFLFVKPRAIESVAAAVGTGLLDPGCAVGGDRCLTPALLEGYLRVHGIAARTIDIGAFEVVVPARTVAPAAVFEFAGVRT